MVFVPHVYQGVGTDDAMGWVMPDGNLSHRLDYRGRNRASNTPGPTVAVGAGAGTGATASIVAGSTDDIGTVSVNVGTSPPAGPATLCTITFHDPWVTAPFVQLQARDSRGATGVYFCTTTTTQLVISLNNTATASSNYLVDYDCTGGS